MRRRWPASLFGAPVPTSIVQLAIPRPELRLLDNLIVFVPMIVAMYQHTRPSQASVNQCTCSSPSMAIGNAGLTGA